MVPSVALAKDGNPELISASRSLRSPSYGWQAILRVPQAPQVSAVFYTYVLESIKDPTRRYTGHTANLRSRLAEHNRGKCRHTANLGPWKLKLYVAFEARDPARRFERYLKSGSGHAFAKRHFWD